MPSRALLLLNPGARRGGAASTEGIAGRLAVLGLDTVPMTITSPHRIPDLIRGHRGSVDRVIVAGGDGTLNAAVQGLVEPALPLQGERRQVEALRTTELEVRTRHPRDINLDGEIGGRTPARFRVLPRALDVFLPAEPA